MPEKAGVGFLEDKGSGSAARDPLIVSYLHPCLPSTPSFSAQDALFSCTAHQLGLKDIAEAMGGKFSFVGAIFLGLVAVVVVPQACLSAADVTAGGERVMACGAHFGPAPDHTVLRKWRCSNCCRTKRNECTLLFVSGVVKQGGRTWQPFVGGKNGHENFRQARIYNFCDKCVVFAHNRKFANLTQ